MANICYSDITFKGDSEEISKLNDYLHAVAKTKGIEDFAEGKHSGSLWLGYVVEDLFGVDPKKTDIGLAWINDATYKSDDSEIDFYVESRWSPQLEVFDLIRKKLTPNAEIRFASEESNERIWLTNKISLAGGYFVNWLDGDFPEDAPFTYSGKIMWEQEVRERAKRFAKVDAELPIDRLCDALRECGVDLAQWERAEVADFCSSSDGAKILEELDYDESAVAFMKPERNVYAAAELVLQLHR